MMKPAPMQPILKSRHPIAASGAKPSAAHLASPKADLLACDDAI